MTRRKKDPLRSLTAKEREVLEQLGRSQNEPTSHVARAKALLAVADGRSFDCTHMPVGMPARSAGTPCA